MRIVQFAKLLIRYYLVPRLPLHQWDFYHLVDLNRMYQAVLVWGVSTITDILLRCSCLVELSSAAICIQWCAPNWKFLYAFRRRAGVNGILNLGLVRMLPLFNCIRALSGICFFIVVFRLNDCYFRYGSVLEALLIYRTPDFTCWYNSR